MLTCVCAKLHQSCLTLCDPMDFSSSGSSVHGIFQARILEWFDMPSSKGSSWPRVRTQVSCLPYWQAGSLPVVPPGRASLAAQMVKNLPAMRETWVQFLGWEDPLEESMATHSGILAWESPWTEKLQSLGSQRVGHNWTTKYHLGSPSMYIFGFKRTHFKSLPAIKELNIMTPASYSLPDLHVEFLKKQCMAYL